MKKAGCRLSASEAEKIKLETFDENDPWQHMMKVMFGCGIYAAFRGCSEHASFSPHMITKGRYPDNFEAKELAGLEYVQITNFVNDKSHKLTVHQGYSRDMSNAHRYIYDPTDDGNFAASMWRLKLKLSPGQTRMYCYPKAQISGAAFLGHDIFNKDKPIGENTVRSILKRGGIILDLPENFLPHSLRSVCISNLVNDGSVSIVETMAVARHCSVGASAPYQSSNGHSELNRLKALGIAPRPVKKQKVEAPSPVRLHQESCTSSTNSVTSIQEFDANEEEPLVLRGRKCLSEPPSPVKPAPPVSMTQVGIDSLQEEIKSLAAMMETKKKPPVTLYQEAPKPQISDNQIQIMGLRQTVRALKARLESKEQDNLYFESITEDHARDNEELRNEVAQLRRQSDYSDWISNRGYTRDREARDGPRRRY